MKKFLTILVALFLLSSAAAHAEVKMYEGYGEYFMTEETLDFAKNQAEIVAERSVLEQVSVYVETRASMTDHELDDDEIITICKGIMHVLETRFSMESEDDGLKVKALVKAEIDTDELDALLAGEVRERLDDR